MQYDIITIFPDVIDAYCRVSILGRAQKDNKITITAHDLRKYTKNKHHNVDDTPYGGGAGMVMKIAPIHRAVSAIKKEKNTHIILLSAKGKRYTQKDAVRLTQYEQLVFVCGRYEGVDERVAEHVVDEELSIGDYVLTGGELGAMVIVDSVARLLPDVLGNAQSAQYESHMTEGYTEHPHYTTPATFHDWSVPEILLSGNHQKIKEWRERHSNQKD